mmetsp:Transcript_17736/g.35771  ORF Transcript_17736/g.35771 Transcript_17736/m.35771 type:complete len:352 (-) Transcript_17736:1144-2199(-)
MEKGGCPSSSSSSSLSPPSPSPAQPSLASLDAIPPPHAPPDGVELLVFGGARVGLRRLVRGGGLLPEHAAGARAHLSERDHLLLLLRVPGLELLGVKRRAVARADVTKEHFDVLLRLGHPYVARHHLKEVVLREGDTPVLPLLQHDHDHPMQAHPHVLVKEVVDVEVGHRVDLHHRRVLGHPRARHLLLQPAEDAQADQLRHGEVAELGTRPKLVHVKRVCTLGPPHIRPHCDALGPLGSYALVSADGRRRHHLPVHRLAHRRFLRDENNHAEKVRQCNTPFQLYSFDECQENEIDELLFADQMVMGEVECAVDDVHLFVAHVLARQQPLSLVQHFKCQNTPLAQGGVRLS